ncbi:hypothetical protein Mapa_002206 [Marchantia paleacea]|nr:hypothetical protein Mapa_002206 [Marchantia paleacea]
MTQERMDSIEAYKSQIPAHVAMIVCQVLAALYYVVCRVVLVGGMNRIILSFYRDIVAMIILVPAAYFIDRGNRIKFSYNVFVRLLLLGLFGVYGSNYLLFVGIEFTSAEFTSALQPVAPALVALIAIVFGFEEIYWHRRDGQVKALGIAISCIGGVLMTFYKGPAVLPWKFVGDSIPWVPVNDNFPNLLATGTLNTLNTTFHDWGLTGWQFGALCLIGNTLCLALYLNLQGPLLRRYPAPVSVVAYSYGVGTILMGLTGAYAVKDPNAWHLSWNMNLAAIVYTGVLGSALNYSLISWSLHRVGPLFVACYLPVQPVAAALLALAIVGTTVYLGSVIGTVLIMIGLLLVTWAHEERRRLSLLSKLIFQRRYSDSFNFSNPREPLIEVRPHS